MFVQFYFIKTMKFEACFEVNQSLIFILFQLQLLFTISSISMLNFAVYKISSATMQKQ